MSHWNYRVVAKYRSEHPFYTIRECYYNDKDDKIPHSWTGERSSAPFGDSVDELREDINMMLQAFNKPVLVEEFNSDGEAERLVEEK